jgi:hypothetical protein
MVITETIAPNGSLGLRTSLWAAADGAWRVGIEYSVSSADRSDENKKNVVDLMTVVTFNRTRPLVHALGPPQNATCSGRGLIRRQPLPARS